MNEAAVLQACGALRAYLASAGGVRHIDRGTPSTPSVYVRLVTTPDWDRQASVKIMRAIEVVTGGVRTIRIDPQTLTIAILCWNLDDEVTVHNAISACINS